MPSPTSVQFIYFYLLPLFLLQLNGGECCDLAGVTRDADTFVTCNCDVQVCVDSVESGLNAARGGASRLEVGQVT